MCGISAILGGHADARANGAIAAMTAALRHRGPDAQSHRWLPGGALGHARLSIIDLDGGRQPMNDASQRYWIVFNGELYNYRELRDVLSREGTSFRTSSDTEVILAAYLAWGARCLDRFRGMYAFLIWDTAERRAFIARDIFGEKPLYYAFTARGELLVASEIKSIRAAGFITPTLDRDALDAYLCLGYMPPDRTIYSNVHTLPPGHYAEWRGEGGVQPVCYWRPRFETRTLSLETAGEELFALLEQAVRRQMVADVPVGAFLSGGHDSSTIVALMARQSARPVRTFAVGFGEWIDERPYARSVAERYGTEHHDIDLGAPSVGELLERMAEVYDEPFLDPSHVPTYLISQYARRHVKVVLTGDGADELFGGYGWYPLLAASTRASGATLAWFAARGVSRLLGDRATRLARYSQAQALARRWPDPWERYVAYRAGFDRTERQRLRGETHDAVMAHLGSAYYRPPQEVREMDRVLYFDLLAFLPGDILVKVDRAAMAHGLETRAPFLDRDVVEFALSLPSRLKVTSEHTKVLFKSALGSLWPEELRQRGKQGFAAPYREWLGRADVQTLARHVFRRGGALRDCLPGVTEAMATERSYRAWSLLTLGLWLERSAREKTGDGRMMSVSRVASNARVVA